jgi:hypothetical protein
MPSRIFPDHQKRAKKIAPCGAIFIKGVTIYTIYDFYYSNVTQVWRFRDNHVIWLERQMIVTKWQRYDFLVDRKALIKQVRLNFPAKISASTNCL